MSPATRPRDLPPTLGMTLVEGGAEFAVYAGHADSVEVCLYDADDRDGSSERRVPLTARTHGSWYGFLPGVGPGQRYGLRADGPVAPVRGPALQPGEGPARPLRAGHRGRRRVDPRGVRPPGRRPRSRATTWCAARSTARGGAAVRRRRRGFRLGRRRATAHPAGRHRGLRGARAQPHHAAPRGARAPAGHVCRPVPPVRHRPPQGAGRHCGGAAARAGVRLRAGGGPARPDQLLGLQHPRVLRPALEVRLRDRPAGRPRRVQGHGAAAPRRGHRGDPRRGLQPHRRAVGAHRRVPLVARAGQPRLLPARRARPGHRRHRLRQHPRPAPRDGLQDGARLAAVLGERVPRRRLPVRPRGRARTRTERRLRPQPPVPRRAAHRPGPVPRQAHRGALGRRHPRLAHRSVPAAVHRVERPVPRLGAHLLARRPQGPVGRSPPGPRGARAGHPAWPGRRTCSAPATAVRSRR